MLLRRGLAEEVGREKRLVMPAPVRAYARARAGELPEGSGPRVVVCGHTHAAREIDLGDGRVYLNCGTWMDLMKLPALGDDAAVKVFIDSIEAGDVPRVRMRTYVEVTEAGAALRDWAPGG